MADLLDVIMEALQDEPAVLSLLAEAVGTADGEFDAGVELVLLRLRQGRPEDGPVTLLLLRRALHLTVSEARSAHAEAADLLDRCAACCRRAQGVRGRSEVACARLWRESEGPWPPPAPPVRC